MEEVTIEEHAMAIAIDAQAVSVAGSIVVSICTPDGADAYLLSHERAERLMLALARQLRPVDAELLGG